MEKQGKLEEELNFIEHLSSKLCHDIAGVTGAINNTIDFLEDENQNLREHASLLLKQSAKELVSRLQFFRKLYGYIDQNVEDSLFEALNLTKTHLSYSKITLSYEENLLRKFANKIKPNETKTIMNLLFLCSTCIIGVGQINIKLNDNLDELSFELSANIIKFQNSLDILLNEETGKKIEVKNVQAIYSFKLLKLCNLVFKLIKSGEKEMIFLLKINR